MSTQRFNIPAKRLLPMRYETTLITVRVSLRLLKRLNDLAEKFDLRRSDVILGILEDGVPRTEEAAKDDLPNAKKALTAPNEPVAKRRKAK